MWSWPVRIWKFFLHQSMMIETCIRSRQAPVENVQLARCPAHVRPENWSFKQPSIQKMKATVTDKSVTLHFRDLTCPESLNDKFSQWMYSEDPMCKPKPFDKHNLSQNCQRHPSNKHKHLTSTGRAIDSRCEPLRTARAAAAKQQPR